VLSLGVVTVEFIRADVLSHFLLPFIFTVVEEPLIAKSHNTSFTSTSNNFLLGFVVWHGGAFINHLFSDDWLGSFDLLASTDTNLHDTLVKTFLVAFVLSLVKLDGILVGLNLHFLNGVLSA